MTRTLLWAAALLLTCSLTSLAAKFENGGFEKELGEPDSEEAWGAHGAVWGGAAAVTPSTTDTLTKARSGKRCLRIDVDPDSWNGIWQQLPSSANRPFVADGFVLIQGGDLPPACQTLLKAEFYDKNNDQIGELAGEIQQYDTKGKWKKMTLKGTTPRNTAFLRLTIIAGDNPGGEPLTNRIYWDDIDLR